MKYLTKRTKRNIRNGKWAARAKTTYERQLWDAVGIQRIHHMNSIQPIHHIFNLNGQYRNYFNSFSIEYSDVCVCVWLCFFCVLSWSNSFEFLFPIVQTWMFSFCLIYMRKWWCDNHWPACCHYTLLQTSDSTFSKEFFFSIGASTERFEQASIASQFNGCKQISSV